MKSLSNKKIAKNLRISDTTTRNYVAHLFKKIEVHSRSEAMVWAREHGIREGGE
jgi:DNA-binding NarL/FixJ family response regulator